MPTPTYDECVDLINGNLADLSDIKPEEHREVEQAILDYAKTLVEESTEGESGQLQVLANGFLAISDLSDAYPTVGGFNIGGAERLSGDAVDAMYQVTFSEPLTGNYYISAIPESRSTQTNGWNQDNDVIMMIREPDKDGVKILLREVSGNYQRLRINITVVKY